MLTLNAASLVALATLSVPGPTRHHDAAGAAHAVVASPAALPNCWRVAPRLFRSGQPTADGYRQARALGITTVVCLRALPHGRAESRAVGLRYVHAPMQPWSVDEAGLQRVLREIALAEGPVLVHCRRGADRTGAVVAAYRVLCQGWRREAAIREMTGPSFGFWRGWSNLVALIESL